MLELMPGDALLRKRVDIWKFSIPLAGGAIARLNECLNSEERERTGKFHFARDRWRYISARGALRTILGSYLNERPDALTFEYGPFGKPFLARPPAARRLAFNLSH
jgi:4'-phosphopantetheinyl transferase